MAETFVGQDLFTSGPRRYVVEPIGFMVIPRLRLNQPVSGSVSLGPAELGVQVVGRLVAKDEASLDELVGSIQELMSGAVPAVGTLIDMQGHTYPDMSLVSFQRRGGEKGAGFVDRGRECSLAYVARFLRLNPI
ncbi:MAG: hypothetical protein ACK54T_09165 [bacterium]